MQASELFIIFSIIATNSYTRHQFVYLLQNQVYDLQARNINIIRSHHKGYFRWFISIACVINNQGYIPVGLSIPQQKIKSNALEE